MSNVNKFFDAKSKIDSEVYRLEDLADSLYATGNTYLAEQLGLIANHIKTDAELMRTLYSDEIYHSFQQAQEGTANMLKMALAGVLTEPKNKKESK